MNQNELTHEEEEWNLAEARAKLASHLDGRKAARKNRQKRLANSVDGRSLRATGRTEHLNFKATPEIKALLAQHVPRGTVSLWLEEAIIAKLGAAGVDIDA